MSWRQINLRSYERALIAMNGRFGGILTPGAYRLAAMPGVSLDVETFNIREPLFESDWADYLADERPDVAHRYFISVQTNELQIAMVYVDRKLFNVMLPAKRLLFWRGFAEVTADVVTLIN